MGQSSDTDFDLDELLAPPPAFEYSEDPDFRASVALINGEQLPELGPDDEPEPEREPSSIDRMRSKVLRGDHALGHLEVPPPLVEELVDRNTAAAIFGPYGGAKTFLTLDLALCVATGLTFHGRRVTPGRVLYVIAEGAHGFKIRVDAWKEARDVEQVPEILWLPDSVNIFDNEGLVLAELCAELEPALVVLDTLSRCIVGADENGARDMGLVVDRLDRIRRSSGACVLAVHHTGKNADAGLRGSSVLAGALDTILRLENADGYLTLKVEKQKHRADGEQLQYRLRPLAGSLVVETHDGLLDRGDLPESFVEVLAVIDDLDLGAGAPTTSILGGTQIPRRTVHRHLTKLQSLNMCANVGTPKRMLWTLMEPGREALACHRAKGVPTDAMAHGEAPRATVPPPLLGGTVAHDTAPTLDITTNDDDEEPF